MSLPPNSPRWSPGFDKPFTIEFQRSRILIVLLCVMHSGAIAALLLTPLPWIARAALAALVVASAIHALRVQGFRQGPHVVVSLHDNDGNWSVQTQSIREGVLIETQFVHPLAVALKLRGLETKKKYSLLALPDGAAPSEFQHLRARLNTRQVSLDPTRRLG